NVDDKPKSLSSTEKQDQPVSPSNTAAPSITEEQAAATAVAAADIVALPSERADDEGAAEESTEEGSVGLRRRIVAPSPPAPVPELKKRSEEHTSELQSRFDIVCRLLLEKKQELWR